MKIKFLTFGEGHLVSDKEYARLKKAFSKVGMDLDTKKFEGEEYDILMVKGFSHQWKDIPHDHPVVYYSIGTEWKINATKELNEPIEELYFKADGVVHISQYCMESHWAVFGGRNKNETVIIPADEPKLPTKYPKNKKLKLATTSIPRPVKRIDQLEELCKKYDIELVPAWGGVSDFSYYHDCDGYIHLSRKEGMPNTVLEALAYGLPCIVTNYGGAKEAVGNAGIVIQNDPDHVAWNPDDIQPVDELLFEQAIKDFKDNLPRLRLAVRERVLSELNDYVAANQFKTVFERCLALRSTQATAATIDLSNILSAGL